MFGLKVELTVDGINVRAASDRLLLLVATVNPLPHIAHHVVETISVGLERVHRRGACVPAV